MGRYPVQASEGAHGAGASMYSIRHSVIVDSPTSMSSPESALPEIVVKPPRAASAICCSMTSR